MEYWFSLYDVCSTIICQKRGRTQSVMFDFRQRYSSLIVEYTVQEISKNKRKTPTKKEGF